MFFYNEEDMSALAASWTQIEKLVASDKQTNDYATSIAISGDGNIIAFGASNEDPAGLSNAGSVYVFQKTGLTWTEVQKLTASDKEADDKFGASISISFDGSTIAVGASGEDPPGITAAGAVYVFEKSGSTWTEVQKLTASDRAQSDFFGGSISISSDGSTIAVGAVGEDPSGVSAAGSVYVFEKTGSTWAQAAKLSASDKASTDYFGGSVSISSDGSIIAIGARNNDFDGLTNAGAVYIFEKSGSTWTEAQKLTASDAANGNNFGQSVSITPDASSIVVGAPNKHVGTTSFVGVAYVFTLSDSTWTEFQKLVPNEPQEYSSFGRSVSINSDGNVVAVGASLADPDQLVDAGTVYLFTLSDSTWTEVQKLAASDKEANDRFGEPVSISSDGNVLAVLAGQEDPDGASNAGSAYIFQRS